MGNTRVLGDPELDEACLFPLLGERACSWVLLLTGVARTGGAWVGTGVDARRLLPKRLGFWDARLIAHSTTFSRVVNKIPFFY